MLVQPGFDSASEIVRLGIAACVAKPSMPASRQVRLFFTVADPEDPNSHNPVARAASTDASGCSHV